MHRTTSTIRVQVQVVQRLHDVVLVALVRAEGAHAALKVVPGVGPHAAEHTRGKRESVEGAREPVHKKRRDQSVCMLERVRYCWKSLSLPIQ